MFRWYGHIVRLDGVNVVKRVCQSEFKGNNRLGRLTGVSMDDANILVHDRAAWSVC